MKPNREQEAVEVESIIRQVITEIKEEIGKRSNINEIEAALLKRQGKIMSALMQDLVNNQDFPPSSDES
jgi:uncharacterized protein YqeY